MVISNRCWKRTWTHIYGSNKTATCVNIAKLLEELAEDILSGFSYEEYDHRSLYSLQKKLKVSAQFGALIKRVCELLNINVEDGWNILCHYLKFGFHGGPETLNSRTETHVATTDFLQGIWHFFYLERMYHLKTIKLILECHDDEEHPYKIEFKSFLDKITIQKVRTWLMAQFRKLISVKVSDYEDMTRTMKTVWIDHNLSEQVEVLQCILLTHDTLPITPDEFIQMMKLFEAHSLGQSGTYDPYVIQRQKLTRDNVSCHEIAIVLCILDHIKMVDYKDVWSDEAINKIKDWPDHFMLHNYPVSAPMIILWYAKMFPTEERFPPEVKVAVDYVHRLVKLKIFSEDTKWARLVSKSVFHWLIKVSERKDIHYSQEEFAICWEMVLRKPEIADIFLSEHASESPYLRVNDVLIESKVIFPRSFNLFIRIIQGLIQSSENSLYKALGHTKKFPVFTVSYRLVQSDVRINGDRAYLKSNWNMLNPIFGTIAENTQVFFKEHYYMLPTAHIFIEYSFWELLSKFLYTSRDDIRENKPVRKVVILGLELFCTLLSKLVNRHHHTPEEIVILINQVIEILDLMIKMKSVDTDCYAVCIQVIASVKNLISADIYQEFLSLDIFPHFINDQYIFENLVEPQHLQLGFINDLIVEYDMASKKYKLTLSYLKFVTDILFTSDKEPMLSWKIPGVLLITRVVFPKILETKIAINSVEQKIFQICIELIHNVLLMPEELRSNPDYETLHKLCYYEMMNLNQCKSLLNLVMLGDNNLEIIMMNEVDWYNGAGMSYIDTVHECLSILVFLLTSKTYFYHNRTSKNTPLETLLFSGPDKKYVVFFIQSIVTYIRHSFNRMLPIMACQILQIFTEKSDISLNSCFKWDAQEIQYTFIHPLRSRTESDIFKISLLNFIKACIPNQPALTQSFFAHDLEQGEEEGEDYSLVSLMKEFLNLIRSESSYRNHPIVYCLLGIYHQLWKYGKQVLVNDIINLKEFWPSLCNPLFCEDLEDVKTYPMIFNILSIEIYERKDDLNPDLKTIIAKLFDITKPYLKRWLHYLYGTNLDYELEETLSLNIIPNWLKLLQSWKDFLIVSMTCCPYLFTTKNICLIGENCFTGLVNEMTLSNDVRSIAVLAETYLKLLRCWRKDIIYDPEKALKFILRIVSHISDKYDVWQNRPKMSVLALITLCIKLLQEDMTSQPSISLEIFQHICHMTCEPLYRLENEISHVDRREDHAEKTKEYLLVLQLLHVCANTVSDRKEFAHHLHRRGICSGLIKSLANIVQEPTQMVISLAIIDVISVLMKTNCGLDFWNNQISLILWNKLVPPKEFLPPKSANADKNLWKVEDWWKIYSRALKMLVVWLQWHGAVVLNDVFSFILFHETYLIDCITGYKTIMSVEALDICLAVISLVGALAKHKVDWMTFHLESFQCFIKALLMCFHHSVALLLRPMVILQHIESEGAVSDLECDKSEPPIILVTVLNKLVELTHRVSQVLIVVSPSLFDLLIKGGVNLNQYSILLDTSYIIPKPFNEDTTPICFGTLLSAVNLFSRSLSCTSMCKSKSTISLRSAESFPSMRPPSKTDLKLSQMWALKSDNPSFYRHNSSDTLLNVYSSTSLNLMTENWLRYFNEDKTFEALESVLYLLASQSMLIMQRLDASNRAKSYTFRELHSEISVFHELMQKLSKSWRLEKNVKPYSLYSGIKRHRSGTDLVNSDDCVGDLFKPYNKLRTHKLDLLVFLNNIFLQLVDEEEDYL